MRDRHGEDQSCRRTVPGQPKDRSHAAGPELKLFNDLCVMAPAALVDAPISGQVLDDLAFNANHELVDFISDDRSRASDDGRRFTPQRWSPP